MARILFITGTDTGVGKTVFTVALARFLHRSGVNVLAMKPLCSGGREDARALRAALGRELKLDEINPWHFRAALAPVLAARAEGRTVRRADVVAQVRAMAARCEVLLVEGAGGLLSPLGEDFDSRDLITALRARTIVVTANRLGAVGQARLVLAALPATAAKEALVVLMQPARPDAASGSNAKLLAEFNGADRVLVFPRLKMGELNGAESLPRATAAVLKKLI
jgi:dethiobiotin synthetase